MPVRNGAHSAFVALGTNRGDRIAYLTDALTRISNECGSIEAQSSIYESAPLPVPGLSQGAFLNMIIRITTNVAPELLLQQFHTIEKALGRNREEEITWGPRTIDIDLITYEQICSLHSPVLPHPRFHERDFVLVPLREIEPNFIAPMSGESIETLLSRIPEDAKTILRRYIPEQTVNS
ncbi:MAG: 2-amino-4-hydroxy-6-hydroxymethyldihydropteridine diphosphokinase [Bdellovibrionota bacterium]